MATFLMLHSSYSSVCIHIKHSCNCWKNKEITEVFLETLPIGHQLYSISEMNVDKGHVYME